MRKIDNNKTITENAQTNNDEVYFLQPGDILQYYRDLKTTGGQTQPSEAFLSTDKSCGENIKRLIS